MEKSRPFNAASSSIIARHFLPTAPAFRSFRAQLDETTHSFTMILKLHRPTMTLDVHASISGLQQFSLLSNPVPPLILKSFGGSS